MHFEFVKHWNWIFHSRFRFCM